MPATTFTWFPNTGSQHTCKPSVSTVKFGDGYESRFVKGLNNSPMEWQLTFEHSHVNALTIISFLRARNGVESFTWVSPLNESGIYVCREWSSTRNPGSTVVTCKFEQVFEF